MDIQHQILEKMKAYDTIMLFRHSRVDGDCVGATKGMKALIQASFPDKKVLIVDDEHSDYLAFLGEDDAPVADDVYAQSLAIVLDVSVASRISNPKYALCKELVKLDHHINVEPYGDLMWVEEERSSACEMVADFYDKCHDELTLTKDAALYLYYFIVGGASTRVTIVLCLLNVFLFLGGDIINTIRRESRYWKTRYNFRKAMRK